MFERSRYIPFLLLLLLFTCTLGSRLQAQRIPSPSPRPTDSTRQAGDVPLAPGASSMPSSEEQLPENYQQRIEQLRRLGVPESEIQRMLEDFSASQDTPGTPPSRPANARPGDAQTDDASRRPPSESSSTTRQDTSRQQPAPADSLDAEQDLMPRQTEANRIRDSLLEVQDRIYGHHIFEELAGNFNRDPSLTASDDYIIGPGDQLIVTAWGNSELQERLVVEDDGSVFRQRIGKLYLAGLPYGAVKSLLLGRYRRILMAGTNLEITLGQNRRTISVNLVGEVKEPGTYTISANNTVYNALFEAKGVAPNGSVRDIRVKRGGQVVQVFDLYKFWLGEQDNTLFLDNRDHVFVPVQGKIIKIMGGVKRPMRYELTSEENLAALIQYAGGFTYNARSSFVQVRKLKDGRTYYENVDLSALIASGEDYPLEDGDLVTVQEQPSQDYNVVELGGAVKYPALYELVPGERLTDLIQKAGGLDTTAYLKRAYITRITEPGEISYLDVNLQQALEGDTSQNLELQFFDQVLIFDETDFKDQKYIQILGEVRRADSFLVSPSMSLKDALLLARGLKKDADLNNIELSTFRQKVTQAGDSLTTEEPEVVLPEQDIIIRRVSIPENWEEDPRLDTIMVGAYNQIRVYSRYAFQELRYIEVVGSVKKPGRYPVQRGMTLKDIIYQAGGLTEEADVKEVELYKDIDIEEKGFFSTSTDEKEIRRIALEDDWRYSEVADSIEIYGYHRLVIRSEREFLQQGFVQIKGLVNKPGRYAVSPNMTLRDLFYLAGGLRMEAHFENIELSRVIEVEEQQGKIIPVSNQIKQISTTQTWQQDPTLDNIKVHPYDQVFVRRNPEFELQESVFIEGEVFSPGEYTKYSRIDTVERLSSLVARAGGITGLAYVEGAYLIRPNIGSIAIQLDKALRRPGSKFNIPLLANDTLVIPPRMEVVTVMGNVLQPGTTVFFDPQKRRFKHYVNLAGGFDRRTKRKLCTVGYMDGRVKRTKSFLGFKSYPKIEQGAVIYVARKPEKEKGDPDSKPRFSLQEILASATAILTFYLLIDRTIGN